MIVAWSLTTWTALTAVGTIGAVLVALFLDELRVVRQRRREPKLLLSHSPEDSVIEVTYMTTVIAKVGIGGRGAYLRFAVSNAPDRDAAKDVEVLLQRVERLSDDPSGTSERVHIASPPFAWSNVGGVTNLTIPPGVSRVIDVGVLTGPADPAFQQGRERDKRLALGIVPAPADMRHMLPPGRYRLRLVVTATNANAQHYETEIDFDGEWPDDETTIWQHIRLTEPPRRVSATQS